MLRQLCKLAKQYDWTVYQMPSRWFAGHRVLLMKIGQPVLYVALTGDGQVASVEQEEWLWRAGMTRGTTEVYLWRPSDLGKIEARLQK